MLSELFLSLTETVFSYAIDKLDPAETIKTWLKREPARLAFQKSLARAYSAFARRYPEYVTSLFNQSFLEKEAAPELAKFMVRGQTPDPAALAQAWGKSLGLEPHSEFCQRAAKPAGDLLAWLESELKAEPVFQPLFDSRALDSLPRLEEQITKLTAELTRSLEIALKQASEYEKIVLSIGGDVRDSVIVVGDNNQVNISKVYYSGQFTSLNDYYIHPDSVFQRVRVDEFVGREWLTAKVDAFLNNPGQKSGAFVLVGDAGVGKTSFMAHLIKERRYLHLFSEQAPGDANLQRALQSLGAQLVTRYQIDPYKDRDTLTQTAVFPDFLERLMRLATQGLCKGEKIVIVCDALDEAGTFPDGNVLGLPNILPDGVYLIFSQRPVNIKLPNLSLHIEKLEAQDDDNLQDMETYLDAVTKRSEIAGQIHAREYSEAFFIQTLKEKSLGVWMYLHYILREIESGSRAPLELENLPTGLVGYYADYWDDWRNGRRGRGEGPHKWDELYAPLLTTLAAAQEPITIEQLVEWSGVEANPREVKRLLIDSWRAFITERETPKGRLYFPYHLSFRDFITGKVDFEKLSIAQVNLVRDLAEQILEAHQRIVRVFEEACYCKWEALVELDYPRLHLSAHLDGAKEYDKLVQLLTEGGANISWAETKYKKDETYAGYLNDLAYIWKYAEQECNYGLLFRCMLIENSISSLASKLPAWLIAELGKAGLWSYTRCLTNIRQKPNPKEQAESIKLLAPIIPPFLCQEMLAIAREIQNEKMRVDAISALFPHLPDEIKTEALIAAYEIQNEEMRADILFAIAHHVPGEIKAQALAVAREIRYEDERAIALFLLENNPSKEFITQTITTACKIQDGHARSRTLSALAPHIHDELKAPVLAAALEIKDESDRANVLSALAHYLPNLMARILAATRQMWDEDAQACILSALAPNLPYSITIDALEIMSKFKNENQLAQVLCALVPVMPYGLRTQAFAVANQIQDKFSRSRVLFALTPHVSDELTAQALIDMLSDVREIQDVIEREGVLSYLAVCYLPDKYQVQLLAVSCKIKNEQRLAEVLFVLASYLPDDLPDEIIAQALAATFEIKNDEDRIQILSEFAPHLSDNLKIQGILHTGQLQSEAARVNALSTLVPHLSDVLKAQALAIVFEIQNEFYRANALSTLAPHLPDTLKARALAAVFEIQNGYYRTNALSTLAPHLSDTLKAQALAAVFEIQDGYDRTNALSTLVPYLPDNLKTQALAVALETQDGDSRAHILEALAPHLPDNLKVQALAGALEIHDDIFRSSILEALAPHLPDNLKAQALAAALEIQREWPRANALAALVPYLQDELKAQVLTAVREFSVESHRTKILSVLAPCLTDRLRVRALVAMLELKDYRDRAIVLAEFVPYLSDKLKLRVLSATRDIQDEPWRAVVLSELAMYLPDKLKARTLTVACEIRDAGTRFNTLIELIPHLTNKIKTQALTETLVAVREMSEFDRALALTDLVSLLPDDLKDQALAIAYEIKVQNGRFNILSTIASCLPNELKTQVYADAFAAACETLPESARASALSALAPHLPNELIAQALDVARRIWDESNRAVALSGLAPYLPDTIKTLALEAASEIQDESVRAGILSSLVPVLSDDLKVQALAIAREIQNETARAIALSAMAPYWEKETKKNIFQESLFITNKLEELLEDWKEINYEGLRERVVPLFIFFSKKTRNEGLIRIDQMADTLFILFGKSLAPELYRAITDVTRWWP